MESTGYDKRGVPLINAWAALKYVEWTTGGTYTWDVPADLQQGGVVEVDAAAGGGGGGGGFSAGGGGGGGSGSEWCEDMRLFIPIGATQLTIEVGAGGVGGAGGGAPIAGSDGGWTKIKYGSVELLALNYGRGGAAGAAALPGAGASSHFPWAIGGGAAAANANGGEPNLTNAHKANFTDGRWTRGQIYPSLPAGAGTFATSASWRSSRLFNVMYNQFQITTPSTLAHSATDTGLGGACSVGYVPKNVGGLALPFQSNFSAPTAADSRLYGCGGRGGRAAGSTGFAGMDGLPGFVRLVY